MRPAYRLRPLTSLLQSTKPLFASGFPLNLAEKISVLSAKKQPDAVAKVHRSTFGGQLTNSFGSVRKSAQTAISPEIAEPEQPPTYGRLSAKAHPLQILEQ